MRLEFVCHNRFLYDLPFDISPSSQSVQHTDSERNLFQFLSRYIDIDDFYLSSLAGTLGSKCLTSNRNHFAIYPHAVISVQDTNWTFFVSVDVCMWMVAHKGVDCVQQLQFNSLISYIFVCAFSGLLRQEEAARTADTRRRFVAQKGAEIVQWRIRRRQPRLHYQDGREISEPLRNWFANR